jgi:hypothetical protein
VKALGGQGQEVGQLAGPEAGDHLHAVSSVGGEAILLVAPQNINMRVMAGASPFDYNHAAI